MLLLYVRLCVETEAAGEGGLSRILERRLSTRWQMVCLLSVTWYLLSLWGMGETAGTVLCIWVKNKTDLDTHPHSGVRPS